MNTDRSQFIGGSDISGIMGISRWATPLSVWAEKTKNVKPKEQTEQMEMGIVLEETIARLFSEKTNKKVRVDRREFIHEDHSYMIGHIDRWIVGGEVLECKNCIEYKIQEWEGDNIPNEYFLQLNWYLGLTKKKTGYLAVLIGGRKFIWKKIEFNHDLFTEQINHAKNFWENFVLTNTPPMACSQDKEILESLYPENSIEEIITYEDEDLIEDLIMINELQSEIKKTEILLDSKKNKIRQAIGENTGIEAGNFKATWKSQERKICDINKMKNDGIYEKYLTSKTSRVLRIRKQKK